MIMCNNMANHSRINYVYKGIIVDEECIIVMNEEDLLKFIDTVDNFIEENNSK